MKNLRILSLAVATCMTLAAVSCNPKVRQEEDEPEVLDKVVVEEEAPTVVEIASASPDHTTLVTAISEAGMIPTLNDDGPYTIFAPTNEGFEALPEGTVENLLKEENKEKLQDILKYHVVSGEIMAADLEDGKEITTVHGNKLKVSIRDSKVYVNDAQITGANMEGKNGVVHIIDAVLLPD